MKDWKFHCSILGVRENATPKEIRRAYRKLALLRHPDKHHGSNRAKEEFQQLNESYRHLLSASPGTARAQAAHAPNGATTSRPAPAPPRRPFNAPVLRRNSMPMLQKIRPKNFGQVLVHSAVACILVLGISLWTDQQEPRFPASGRDSRDLSLTAFCSISHPERSGRVLDASETLTERACGDKCKAFAAKSGVVCSWDRKEFFSSPLEKQPAEAAASQQKTEEQPGRCEISLIKNSLSTKVYRAPKQAICQEICAETMRYNPKFEVNCSWESNEFKHQAAKEKALDSAPAADAVRASPQARPASIGGDGGPARATCFMSVVVPGDPQTFELENETEEGCIRRCQGEIIAHPLGREIRCNFFGKSVVTYVPDAVASYLARNPAQAQNAGALGICELSVWRDDTQIGVGPPMATEEAECKMRCESELNRTSTPAVLVCKFKGTEFVHQQGRSGPKRAGFDRGD